MKALKLIGAILVILVVVFVGFGMTLPGTYDIERKTVIAADRAQVHALVGDLDKWPVWSPWIENDPTIKTTIVKATGVGAEQSWTSESGPGHLKFTETSSLTGIGYDMSINHGEFKSKATMKYEAQGNKTAVSWRMWGQGDGLIGKYFAYFTDSMVGPMFERGLEKLKQAAEKGS